MRPTWDTTATILKGFVISFLLCGMNKLAKNGQSRCARQAQNANNQEKNYDMFEFFFLSFGQVLVADIS